MKKQISDTTWFEMNCTPGLKTKELSSIQVPLLPSDDIQLRFTGRTSRQNLEQAFEFYRFILTKVPSPESVVDFGGGWGRILRFFLREVNPQKLYLVDCLTDAIMAAKATNPAFKIIQTLPGQTCPLDDASIDLVYAFSVFSHLSESFACENLKDFNRMLKPGGVVAFTTRGQQHLDFLREKLAGPNTDRSGHLFEAIQTLPNLDLIEKTIKAGEYQFFPTGGGGELSSQFYGETWIGEGWVKKNYRNLGYKKYEMFPEHGSVDQVTFILHK